MSLYIAEKKPRIAGDEETNDAACGHDPLNKDA